MSEHIFLFQFLFFCNMQSSKWTKKCNNSWMGRGSLIRRRISVWADDDYPIGRPFVCRVRSTRVWTFWIKNSRPRDVGAWRAASTLLLMMWISMIITMTMMAAERWKLANKVIVRQPFVFQQRILFFPIRCYLLEYHSALFACRLRRVWTAISWNVCGQDRQFPKSPAKSFVCLANLHLQCAF